MNIQLYASNARIEAERDTMNVYLEDIDLSLLVGQFNTDELLDEIDITELTAYLDSKNTQES